jgi:hypothetical protein
MMLSFAETQHGSPRRKSEMLRLLVIARAFQMPDGNQRRSTRALADASLV